MKSLSLNDAIISSIYNAQDNANIVWKGHWARFSLQLSSYEWVVNMLKASVQTQASQSSYLGLSAHFNWNHTKRWEWWVNLEVSLNINTVFNKELFLYCVRHSPLDTRLQERHKKTHTAHFKIRPKGSRTFNTEIKNNRRRRKKENA